MKAFKLFDEIYDKEVADQSVSRRDAMTKGLGFGLKALLAAVPFGLMETATNKAYASPGSAVTDILNFALTLEYLESTYYTMGLASSGLIPSTDTAVFMQISKHETAHVALLQTTITSLGGTPIAKPNFDFTAGGTYADVFSNYQTFLALSNGEFVANPRFFRRDEKALAEAGRKQAKTNFPLGGP